LARSSSATDLRPVPFGAGSEEPSALPFPGFPSTRLHQSVKSFSASGVPPSGGLRPVPPSGLACPRQRQGEVVVRGKASTTRNSAQASFLRIQMYNLQMMPLDWNSILDQIWGPIFPHAYRRTYGMHLHAATKEEKSNPANRPRPSSCGPCVLPTAGGLNEDMYWSPHLFNPASMSAPDLSSQPVDSVRFGHAQREEQRKGMSSREPGGFDHSCSPSLGTFVLG
jgi:hypothetical protein